MTVVLITFGVTTAIYAVRLWMAMRRITNHLKENPDGCRDVMEHVILPIFGGKEKRREVERKPEAKADVRKTKATLV